MIGLKWMTGQHGNIPADRSSETNLNLIVIVRNFNGADCRWIGFDF